MEVGLFRFGMLTNLEAVRECEAIALGIRTGSVRLSEPV